MQLLENTDPLTRDAYSHEVISFGFWPGDREVREPTFYSYTAPEPRASPNNPYYRKPHPGPPRAARRSWRTRKSATVETPERRY